MKVFLSYSWDLLTLRAALNERLKLLGVIPIVDREIVNHGDQSMHENIRRHLLESDLVVVVLAEETLKSVEVREELTLAHTWGIPIICFSDKGLDRNARDKIPWFLRDKLECRFDSRTNAFADDILDQLDRIIKKKLLEKERPDTSSAYSRLEIHRILRKSNELLMSINDKEHFRLGIAQKVVQALNKELDNLRQSDYTVNLSLDQNFLLRACGLFANSSGIYATSIDSLSSFWIASDSENALRYTHIQPLNTMRLFVFSSASSMHQYRNVLTEHHRQYGAEGGVFMCTIDSYDHLISSLLSPALRRQLAWALRIKEWLKEPAQGFEGTFLDFDPQNGIPAGRDWEKELYHQLRRCRAVIALCSEHFNASQWCLSEVAIASNLGKCVFPVEIAPCSPPALLRKNQMTRFTQDSEEGFLRLAQGLAETGLDPKDIFQWDGKRTPYPGLMAFQEADAPVLFGRDQEIQEGLDRLHNLRRYGGKALLLVLGASGCGKSSLVRAGIVPRLRRDPENWLVLEPFRPRSNPFAELADVLAQAFRALGETPPAPPTTAQENRAQLEDLRRRRGHREASVVVVIDQFEELLAGDGSGSGSTATKPGDGSGSSPVERFLAFLRDATEEDDGRLVVLATLRSDFFSSFQCHPALVGVPFKDLKLGPMEAPDYARVIEGPAEVAGLVLEAGLTDRMVADTFTGDALPLLAFTLREMWERYGKDGDLSLSEYKLLGGLEGSVQRAADGVHGARPLSAEEEEALRRAFLQLCRINEEGQHARSTAQWEELPPTSRETLQRFVKARLLVSGKQNGTIEVAHEALLRTWPLLRRWLEESQEFLLWKRRFQGAMEEYKISGTLLAGKPLEEAEIWRDQTAENSAEGRMIDASLAARGRRRCRNLLLAGVAGLAVAGFTGGLWWQLQTIRQWQAQVFLKEHHRLIESDPLESVVNGLAAMAHSLESDPGRRLALSDSLPRVMAGIVSVYRQPIQTGQGGVRSLIELKNGELISGGSDGSLRRWRDGKPVGDGRPIATGQGVVWSLTELKNGELISGGHDGTLRRWRAVTPVEGSQPIRTGQRWVSSLIGLKNGELISGGQDGTLRRWRDGNPVGQTIQTGQGEVRSLIELKNGELISVGAHGTLRRWRESKPVGQTIQTGQGEVRSLIELKNGELISGGNDGTLRRWRDGRSVDGGLPIQTGQGWVSNLIELMNGELISGGEDGTLRRWRDGKPVGQTIQPGQGELSSLIELRDGELISIGWDELRRWRDGRPVDGGLPIKTGQRGPVELIELQNGELISGGLNGTLRRWRDGKPVDGGQPIKTGQGSVVGLIELYNGELVSGGGDGTLRRWRHGKPVDGGQPIKTGQGRVVSLIELKNGELDSRGGDGTLRWFSPRRVVGFACGEALPELMRSPETMEDKEASSLCRRFGFLR